MEHGGAKAKDSPESSWEWVSEAHRQHMCTVEFVEFAMAEGNKDRLQVTPVAIPGGDLPPLEVLHAKGAEHPGCFLVSWISLVGLMLFKPVDTHYDELRKSYSKPKTINSVGIGEDPQLVEVGRAADMLASPSGGCPAPHRNTGSSYTVSHSHLTVYHYLTAILEIAAEIVRDQGYTTAAMEKLVRCGRVAVSMLQRDVMKKRVAEKADLERPKEESGATKKRKSDTRQAQPAQGNSNSGFSEANDELDDEELQAYRMSLQALGLPVAAACPTSAKLKVDGRAAKEARVSVEKSKWYTDLKTQWRRNRQTKEEEVGLKRHTKEEDTYTSRGRKVKKPNR